MRRERLTEASDRALAQAVIGDGDESAFRALYRRHTPRLYQFVLRLVGGVETDAEDIVQETWLRAVEHLDEFRWESRLSTWLSGIALNLCRGLWRRRDGREVQWVDGTDQKVPLPILHERVDLERAIALLPDGYRTVLILHDLEGFTHAEIGERLGVAAGTSKSQLFQARRAVRSLLNPENQT